MDHTKLTKGNISTNAAYPVLHALRFLGFIDDEHRITGEHQIFFKPEEDKKRYLEKLVTTKYGPLLERLSLPITDMEDLLNVFQETYGSAESVTVLNQSFFLWICKEAGILLFGETRPHPRRRRVKDLNQGTAELSTIAGFDPSLATHISSPHGKMPVSIVCHVNVNPDTSVEQIHAMIARVQKAVAKFHEDDG
ncbi:hypothetical protein ACFLU6_03760 [Acidobacteriota bacterium]